MSDKSKRTRRVMTPDERTRIWVRSLGRCQYCNIWIAPNYYSEVSFFSKIAKKWDIEFEPMEADHYESYISGGEQSDKNMIASCKTCNRKKGSSNTWVRPKVTIIGRILYQLYPMISKELKQELNSRKEK